MKLHVNPLRKKIVYMVNEVSGSTARKKAPMSMKDAATVSAILAVAGYFTGFLIGLNYADLTLDPGEFVFNSIRFIGSQFFTYLLVMSGLSRIAKDGEE